MVIAETGIASRSEVIASLVLRHVGILHGRVGSRQVSLFHGLMICYGAHRGFVFKYGSVSFSTLLVFCCGQSILGRFLA